jgi:hypothetical protein
MIRHVSPPATVSEEPYPRAGHRRDPRALCDVPIGDMPTPPVGADHREIATIRR